MVGSSELVPSGLNFEDEHDKGGGGGPEDCSTAGPGDDTAAAVKDLEGWQGLDSTEGWSFKCNGFQWLNVSSQGALGGAPALCAVGLSNNNLAERYHAASWTTEEAKPNSSDCPHDDKLCSSGAQAKSPPNLVYNLFPKIMQITRKRLPHWESAIKSGMISHTNVEKIANSHTECFFSCEKLVLVLILWLHPWFNK